MWYHWIRNVLYSKVMELEKIHTDDNGLDMLVKTLSRERFEACCLIAGLAFVPT